MARTEGNVKFKVVVQSDEAKAGFEKVGRYRDQFAKESKIANQRIGESFGAIKNAFGGFAALAIGKTIFSSVMALNKEFAGIADSAENARMSVEDFSTLKFISDKSGVGIDQVTNSLNKLDDALQSAGSEGGAKLDAFKKLGLLPSMFEGKSQIDKLNLVSNVYKDSTDKTQTLMQLSELLGVKISKMPALLNAMGSSYAESSKEAVDALGTLTTSQVMAAKIMDDKWNNLIQKVKTYSQAAIVAAAEVVGGPLAVKNEEDRYKKELEINEKRARLLGPLVSLGSVVTKSALEISSKSVASAFEEIKIKYKKLDDFIGSTPLFKSIHKELDPIANKMSKPFEKLKADIKDVVKTLANVDTTKIYARSITKPIQDDFKLGGIDQKPTDFEEIFLTYESTQKKIELAKKSINAFEVLKKLKAITFDNTDKSQVDLYNDALSDTNNAIDKIVDGLTKRTQTEEYLYQEQVKNIDAALANNNITKAQADTLKNDLMPANIQSIEFAKKWRDSYTQGTDAASEYADALKKIADASDKNVTGGLTSIETLKAQTEARDKYINARNQELDKRESLSSDASSAKSFLDQINGGFDSNAETVRSLGKGMVEMWAKGMISAEEYGRTLNRIRFQYSSLGTVTNSFAQSVGDNWGQVILGSKTASEALTGIWQGLASSVVSELMRIYVVQKIIGFIGNVVAGIGNPTQSFAGGATDAVGRSGYSMAAISGMAAGGGQLSAKKTYLVGENGPELFSPDRDGYIMNNGRMNDMQNSMGRSNTRGQSNGLSITVNANDAAGVNAVLDARMKNYMKNAYYFGQNMEARS